MRVRPPLCSAFVAAVLTAACHPSLHAQQPAASVPAVNPADREAVRALYRDHYLASASVPPAWTGNVATGMPGAPGAAYRCATLRRINYFRAMSGLPGNVSLDVAAGRKCQQAALMMAAEGKISHQPSLFWRYYTLDAAEAAANSALALDTQADEGPGAIDRYMADDGPTNALVGHRRWLLYPGTTHTGLGIVPPWPGHHLGANATWVCNDDASRTPAGRAAVAWPPAGYVPAPLVYTRWSFSYPDADFSRATVSVTKQDQPLVVSLEPLGYQSRPDGSGTSAGNNTLAWTLPGNTVGRSADERYVVCVDNVFIAGGARRFTYPVTSIPADASNAWDANTLAAPRRVR